MKPWVESQNHEFMKIHHKVTQVFSMLKSSYTNSGVMTNKKTSFLACPYQDEWTKVAFNNWSTILDYKSHV